MGKVSALQSAFNAGEVSPRMLARVDIDQYRNAAETAKNLLAIPQGGFTRRPGTRHVAEVSDSTAKTRLLSFEFNVEQAYIIEAGNNYLRFFRDQGQIVADDTDASITNGTFDSNINDWDDRSGAGGSISHDSTNNRLNLNSDGVDDGHAEQDVTVGTDFKDNEHALKFQVFGAQGDEVLLRVGTTSTGTEVVNDVAYPVGYHVVTFTPGATTFYVQFLHTTDKTLQIDNVSLIDNAPIEVDTPYETADLFDIQTAQSADVMYLAVGGTTRVYKLLRFGHADWTLEEVWFEDGPYLDQNTTSTTLNPASTSGNGVTVTASSTTGINGGDGFLSTDVGRLIRIQHSGSADIGYGIIVARNSATSVDVDIQDAFNAATANADWWLGAWSETTGYPSTVTFFEQRLVFANTSDNPQGFWMSQSADLENYRPDSFVSSELTVEDDDALAFTIASTEVNSIRWMSAQRNLILGTTGGEWAVSSSSGTVTPTDVSVNRQAANGSANIQPVSINEVTLFVQRAKRKVLDLGFVFEVDGFRGRDTTILSDHITRGGIVEMAYQQEPDSIVWVVRDDGALLALTYKPDQEVIGWTPHTMGGVFETGDAVVESVSVIPGSDASGQTLSSEHRDEVWVIVKRTINNATKRFVEFFEGQFEGPIRHDYDSDSAWEAAVLEQQADSFYLDSGLSYIGAAGLGSTDRVFYIDSSNDDLRAYKFDNTDWSQEGNSLAIANIGQPALAALNVTDVAFIDLSEDELRLYRFDVTDFSQVGSSLSIADVSTPALAALSETDVAFIDSNNKELRKYRFDEINGTWAQIGNSLSISGVGLPALAALSSNTVALIDGSNDELRTYQFDGTDWAQVGNGLAVSAVATPALAALTDTDVAFVDSNNGDIRTYRWDDTDWAQVGNDLNIGSVGASVSIAALSDTDIAYIDSLNNDLRTYRFDGADWAQVGNDLNISSVSGNALAAFSAGTSTLSGLDHLEGETVKVVADGSVHPDRTVSSGSITLDLSVTKAHVGLGYTHHFQSLKLAYGARAGTAVGKIKRVHGITFVLLDTATFSFGRDLSNLNEVIFRQASDEMDTATPLFTGERHVDFGGQYDRDARIHISSDNPLPWTVLAIAPEMKTNESL